MRAPLNCKHPRVPSISTPNYALPVREVPLEAQNPAAYGAYMRKCTNVYKLDLGVRGAPYCTAFPHYIEIRLFAITTKSHLPLIMDSWP